MELANVYGKHCVCGRVYLANVQTIDTTWKTMDIEDNMHAILLNGVRSDFLDVRLLVPRMVLRTWNLDPRCVGGRNAKKVHSARGKLINVIASDVRRIALLKDRCAPVAQFGAAIPLIGGTVAICVPEIWIDGGFLAKPSTEIDAIGSEVSPVDVVAAVRCSGGC